eukprot:TRINITY_DN4319_c1_g1_i1.p1 TRINITY_DN4319_c1_g1~~TRINITY_DN4319_c1_g1_i1.p1  ORF type:complete len:669 (+),score=109.02 TRINITY_DN4319_c1_g1_i1:149-2008(+)
MQGLNEILAWEKNLRKGNIQGPPPTTRTVKFYTKEEDTVIECNFVPPKDPESPAEGSSSVNQFLNQLLTKAEVLSPEEQQDLDKVNSKLEEWRNISKTVSKTETTRSIDDKEWAESRREQQLHEKFRPMGDFGAAFDAQGMEVPHGAHEAAEIPSPMDGDKLEVPLQPIKRIHKVKTNQSVLTSLADEFDSLMKDYWKPEHVPDIAGLIASDLIHYDKELSPVDCAKAIDTLGANLSLLRYDKWYFIPLYVTSRFGIGVDLPGFLSIPYWFQPDEFIKYILAHEDELSQLQESAHQSARELEEQILTAKESAGLVDVILRCDHEDGRKAVEVLIKNASVLKSHGVTKLCVEITDPGLAYGSRESGVLQLPADVTDSGLLEFCEYLNQENRLESVRQLYNQSIETLSECDRLMSVCYEVISPYLIDIESSNATPEEKLSFVKELYSISGELSRYDWSAYTLVLGDLDLDWAGGVLSLPFNFHGANLAKTIHMLHEEDTELLDEEPESETDLALELEGRRIKADLAKSGLIELDPSKQTESQRKLLESVNNFESGDDLQQYIKDNFPEHFLRQEAENATQAELLAQVRVQHDGYRQRRLRYYFKHKMHARVGPRATQWQLW